MFNDLVNKYVELKKESVGTLRTNVFTYEFLNLSLRRIYSDSSMDILAQWNSEYEAELWLNSHINKFIEDKYPKQNNIQAEQFISPLMETQNV